jgi:acetyltransferase-like isoleucine patch superfamily enzyme
VLPPVITVIPSHLCYVSLNDNLNAYLGAGSRVKIQAQFKRIYHASWYDRITLACDAWNRAKTALFYRRVFHHVGARSRVDKPLLLRNPACISIGSDTLIRAGARLEAVVLDPAHPPALRIGSNVNIEQNVHLLCSSSITIEDNVTITGNCAIVDTRHPFRDIHDDVKIGSRIDPSPTPVTIGRNTFIGFGTVILPNVRIGQHCIIGANSTVTHDIPDYSVASGSPARVTLRYNQAIDNWE